MAFVLDASVALCWFVPGQESIQSSAILKRAEEEGVEVPFLWHIEVANQLGLKLRRKSISLDNLSFATEVIGKLTLVTNPPAGTPIHEIVAYMNRHSLTAYDAEYLALAMRRNLPIATFDKELIAATKDAGIALIS